MGIQTASRALAGRGRLARRSKPAILRSMGAGTRELSAWTLRAWLSGGDGGENVLRRGY